MTIMTRSVTVTEYIARIEAAIDDARDDLLGGRLTATEARSALARKAHFEQEWEWFTTQYPEAVRDRHYISSNTDHVPPLLDPVGTPDREPAHLAILDLIQ